MTRVAVVVRLRHAVNRRRSAALVLGCLPGLLLGLPVALFRRLILGLVLVTGLTTVATSVTGS